MSGVKIDEPESTNDNKLLWKFAQSIPVPSYLIAIVVGKLAKKTLGSKSVVFSEPEIIKECAYEFAEVFKSLLLHF